MDYTTVSRWMREPTDAHKLVLERVLNDSVRYVWTGYPGHAYGVDWVWELRLYWISDAQLMLVDTLLSEYFVDVRTDDNW